MEKNDELSLLIDIEDKLGNQAGLGGFLVVIGISLFYTDRINFLAFAKTNLISVFLLGVAIAIFWNYFKAKKKIDTLRNIYLYK